MNGKIPTKDFYFILPYIITRSLIYDFLCRMRLVLISSPEQPSTSCEFRIINEVHFIQAHLSFLFSTE